MADRNGNWARTGVVTVVAAAALASACTRTSRDETSAPPPPVAVRTATAAVTEVTDTFDAGGVVQARTTAAVAARLVAQVREVRVAPGDRVRRGHVLIVLDGRDLDAQARAAIAASAAAADSAAAARAEEQAAHAALTLARATHSRIAGLHAVKSATAHELDQATAALQAADSRVVAAAARVNEAGAHIDRTEATRDAATATASYLTLTAPFDGLVSEKLVEPGNMTAPGQPLLMVEDIGSFRVDVRVDQSRTRGLTPGTTVEVVLDHAVDRPVVVGTVSEVSRAVQVDERAVLVKVTLPSTAAVQTGAFARVRFPAGTRRALTVPPEAIVTDGQVTSAFVVENGTARVRLVRVREHEVLAGLAEGDVVIVSPPPGLADGRPVTTTGGAQ